MRGRERRAEEESVQRSGRHPGWPRAVVQVVCGTDIPKPRGQGKGQGLSGSRGRVWPGGAEGLEEQLEMAMRSQSTGGGGPAKRKGRCRGVEAGPSWVRDGGGGLSQSSPPGGGGQGSGTPSREEGRKSVREAEWRRGGARAPPPGPQSFAEETLRTLCLAYKRVDEDTYEEWRQRHREASLRLQNRAHALHQVYEEMEKGLQVGGARRGRAGRPASARALTAPPPAPPSAAGSHSHRGQTPGRRLRHHPVSQAGEHQSVGTHRG